MVQFFSERFNKVLSLFFLSLFYSQFVTAAYVQLAYEPLRLPVINSIGSKYAQRNGYFEGKSVASKSKDFASPAIIKPSIITTEQKDDIGGPTQPETQSFQSVNSSNMVDLFSGDFSYNIPLMDVGGYPVNISYRSGISMDQEASWVGLGWNINPGAITRNMRGLPDDFNGKDSVTKTLSVKENKTVGVTVGYDMEVVGLSKYKGVGIGASIGVTHNNYRGWGLETSLNASIGAGSSGKGSLSGGLGINNSSQDGLTITPTFSASTKDLDERQLSTMTGNVGLSLPYNTRGGLKGLQISGGLSQGKQKLNVQWIPTYLGTLPMISVGSGGGASSAFSSGFSFVNPTYNPSIQLPYTNTAMTFTAKLGVQGKVVDQAVFVSGYVSKQDIKDEDKTLSLPAYGYLNYQNAADKQQVLLDFNREKDIPYREKPALPTIAVPSYTYDAFTIAGEGTGGMFRAYRGDIGFMHDPQMRTKDNSARISADLALGDLVHGGVDLNLTRAYTQTGAWLNDNPLAVTVAFQKPYGKYEAAYFRNPGEKTINSKAFYDAIGGDDVVTAELYQSDKTDPLIKSTGYLSSFKNKKLSGKKLLTATNALRTQRDKRGQVISYLTAEEASRVGLSTYIENYTINNWALLNCGDVTLDNVYEEGKGLLAEYFTGTNFNVQKYPSTQGDIPIINNNTRFTALGNTVENYSIRWTGRLKPESSGRYTFKTLSDDGIRLTINDSVVIDHFTDHGTLHGGGYDTGSLNLAAGVLYNIKLEYYNHTKDRTMILSWSYQNANGPFLPIPIRDLYLMPAADTFPVSSVLSKEKRVNSFRKSNHISEIDVLNPDGRKYVYGLPVYNLRQREATFAINKDSANKLTGMTAYGAKDDSVANTQNNDHYFTSEEIPAYAHSFLITGILSPDYVDVTGNGITDDDLGDAVKFNYSKVAGIRNPYGWRAPYVDSATYNEGLKTDTRDDKGSYVYGEKELWYLHSIVSKDMIATFKVSDRKDLVAINRSGVKDPTKHYAKELDEINLYTKAAFLKDGTKARPVKTVHFEYTHELCMGTNGKLATDSGKLTLKRIWFSYNGNNKGKRNPYVFVYNTKNPTYDTRSYDRWGSYKDALQNPGSTTNNLITNAEFPYALQDSTLAANNAAAWTLDSIALPSGGRMKITYESDDYAYVQNRRATQMMRIIGFSKNTPTSASDFKNEMYSGIDPASLISQDNLFVGVRIPTSVGSAQEAFTKYLDKIEKLYFKIFVKMPSDKFGSGYEYVPGYASPDFAGGYGVIGGSILWFKVKGIDLTNSGDGRFSPFAKTAIQFLRLNLPSKAYPGSDTGDDLDLGDAVKILASQATNVMGMFASFDMQARVTQRAKLIDTLRSFIRLYSPNYKKMGGGLRVKRIKIYDHWNSMTNQRESVYGQEYTYTTTKEINGVPTTISSGVATYEPLIGGEENPWHNPIEYNEQVAPLAPVSMGYVEEPMGESFFPGASVGYSKVKVRSINTAKRKSANGYEETGFYTSYDFPTITDRTVIDVDTKKRFKPDLTNFLRINARHFLTVSQGFKVELNDMNGKAKYNATYPETDTSGPIAYSESFYRVDNKKDEFKHLNNVVMAIQADGTIDSAAIIGKDAELMMDMREEQSITNGNNFNVNTDAFTFSFPPVFLLPSLWSLAQREENRYRSVGTTKVIQRYGILDSVVAIDKGSRVVTSNLLFDAETGDVVLTRTQNEFNDSIYNFSYPAYWAYNSLSGAYQNIGTLLDHIFINNGHITSGITAGTESNYFTGGDELLAYSRNKVGGTDCAPLIATFPDAAKIWVVDSSVYGGASSYYFVDGNGKPFTGNDISLKVTRSGRKNISGTVGGTTMMSNPVVKSDSNYVLKIDSTMRVLNTSAVEYQQVWQVEDQKKQAKNMQIACSPDTCTVTIPAVYQDSTLSMCLASSKHPSYSDEGAYLYSSLTDSIGQKFEDQTDGFWECDGTITTGRLNQCGLWFCGACTGTPAVCYPLNKWEGFTVNVNIPSAGTYFVGFAADDLGRVTIDNASQPTIVQNPSSAFHRWNIFPVSLSRGIHSFKIEALNIPNGPGNENPATIGLEIYNATANQLATADTATIRSFTLFSTKNISGNGFQKGYSCPIGYNLDSTGGVFTCKGPGPCKCDTVYTTSCFNPITDSATNPYLYGILGNQRPNKSYVYYADRAETSTAVATNIRSNGTIPSYVPFWKFQGNGIVPQYDTMRWVWNSMTTMFNKKGFELENKDPLGRFNTGLYGYDHALPVAVAQNSHYRESAFEGFEDYGFGGAVCDNTCPVGRHFDFSNYQYKIDTAQSHTGKYSLRIDPNSSIGLAANIGQAGNTNVSLTFNTKSNSCTSTPVLDGITTNSQTILPIFSPIAGTKMLFSAWVKEEQNCNCSTYVNNKVVIIITTASGNVSVTAKPSGNIIEGWQRYEQAIDIPANATSLSLGLYATGASKVYFDDIRLHPFNANMKSFIYDDVNLRLMAELDENNYATFYEYDDDGTLIRVKKETERGVKTIKETRSALLKEDIQ